MSAPHTATEPRRSTDGRRVLAFASAGGHFKQLVHLVGRLADVDEVTWVTYDSGLSRELLETAGRGDDRLEFAPYAAPRDVPNLLRNAAVIRELVREDRYDLALSTGAGIAVAGLPLARAHGVPAVFVESATRTDAPSLSGRILARTPGIALYAQHPGFGRRWGLISSVHDRFVPGPRRPPRPLRRVVVTVGTIRPYGFRRLLDRLVAILPPDVEVLWQTGATDVTDLPITPRAHVAAGQLAVAMQEADVVIAHAGTGTAMTACEHGRCPVLVPRRHAHGEHVDDHQVVTAQALARRGLAVHAEVEDLNLDLLADAACRTVVEQETTRALPL